MSLVFFWVLIFEVQTHFFKFWNSVQRFLDSSRIAQISIHVTSIQKIDRFFDLAQVCLQYGGQWPINTELARDCTE